MYIQCTFPSQITISMLQLLFLTQFSHRGTVCVYVYQLRTGNVCGKTVIILCWLSCFLVKFLYTKCRIIELKIVIKSVLVLANYYFFYKLYYFYKPTSRLQTWIFNEHIYNRCMHILFLIAHIDQCLVLFAHTVWILLIDRENHHSH